MHTRISIVITTHRRAGLLQRNLESLSRMSDMPSLAQVILIENGSEEARGLCETFRQQLPLSYIHRSDPGKGRALQWYLQQVDDGFLLFLDDDVRVSPQLVRQYAAAAEIHGPGHYFGGELKIDYEVKPETWLRPHLPPSASGWDSTYLQRIKCGEVFFSGANYGVYVRDLKSVGGFRTDLGPGALQAGTSVNPTGHEWDLQQRLRENGMGAVFVADAPVWHFVPATNCSPDWALHRIYRNSYFTGIKEKEQAELDGSTARHAFNLMRKYAKARLYALAALVVPDPEKRFHLQRHLFEVRGQLKGYYHGDLHSTASSH